ncbi:hypothetical protein NDU88_006224, partial [Pleurodeles waltl]
MGVMDQLIEECIIGTDYMHFQQLLNCTQNQRENLEWWNEAPFFGNPIECPPHRRKLSRREKRYERLKFQATKENNHPTRVVAENCSAPISFRQHQREDPTLTHAWRTAKSEETDEVGPYFL